MAEVHSARYVVDSVERGGNYRWLFNHFAT
jgi:hypothetical protein